MDFIKSIARSIASSLLRSSWEPAEYFKPVATELFNPFDKVIAHYNDIIDTPMPATPVPKTVNDTIIEGNINPANISPVNEPLQCNGGVGSICTLFADL